MKFLARLAVAAGLLAATTTAVFAGDPASCKAVRFSDIGWTDVTATTATTAMILKDLGYAPKITVLSVPVTFASLKNNNLDVFLGNWMPSMEGDIRAYLNDHSVDVVRANLKGAKYTLAVPTYTYDAGLHDFADIHKFATQLHHKIYGIEPGNDGNRHVLKMIKDNMFDLGNFQLVESSEQGMLAEVARAVRDHKPIVFLGWEPHPMNKLYPMKYLTGGDALFGPNYGEATVYTNTRAGYSKACPNVGKLLANLEFNLPMEDDMMNMILTDHDDPGVAAAKYLKAHPEVLDAWLAGVTTFDGQPALPVVKKDLGVSS
ncbi:MAG TPA: choline ABC transporter substrate-binding protein [Acetobacteraceae bacterium]|nr:choline ABC transporter substrate-binding protein [Acetobacteraceae bacterium]